MYKVLFFKFFLFVLYMTAGLFSRVTNTDKKIASQGYDQETLNNIAMAGDPSIIGIATKWVNPYVTRFKVTEKTTVSTTTTKKTTTTVADDDEIATEEETRFKMKRSIIHTLRIKEIKVNKLKNKRLFSVG
jgi:hypothetical protein